MAGDEGDPAAGHVIGDRHRLLGIAGIVADVEVELLAEHAARGVDVFDGQFRAVLHLRAEGGVLPGHRTDDGDRRGSAFLAVAAAGDQDGEGEGCDQPGHALHCYLPLRQTEIHSTSFMARQGEVAQAWRSRQVSGLVRS